MRQRQGGPLDTETLYASLSLPVLENLTFFGRYGGGPGGPVDLRATDQAAAAELDALTAPLRSRLAGLPNYTRPGTARDHLSVPGFTPDSDLHRAVLSAFDALVAGLRAAREAIRGPNATNQRAVLDLACLPILLCARDAPSMPQRRKQARPSCACSLALSPTRSHLSRPAISLPEAAWPMLNPCSSSWTALRTTRSRPAADRARQARHRPHDRPVQPRAPVSSLGESGPRSVVGDPIHVADRAALEERALAVAIETDLAMNATREHIEAVPALLEPRDARFL